MKKIGNKDLHPVAKPFFILSLVWVGTSSCRFGHAQGDAERGMAVTSGRRPFVVAVVELTAAPSHVQ